MAIFYFLYGSDESFPFQYGWTEVEAPSYALACAGFRRFHPVCDEGRYLNCQGVYTEEQFKELMEWGGDVYKDKDRCHERIRMTFERELLDVEKTMESV